METNVAAGSITAPPMTVEPTKMDLPDWLVVKGKSPAVRALLLANTVVFAAMTGCTGIRSLLIPTSQTLLHFGASSGGATIIDGQFWRIGTSEFIHIGLLHLMMNAYVLWDVGPLVERLYGTRRFLAIYFIAGIGASLFSLLFDPSVVSAGASGAIFGLFGALGAFFWCHRTEFPSGFLRMHAKILGVFVIYGIVYGSIMQGVDNAAHIGGLMMGLTAALSLMPFKPGETKFEKRDLYATIGSLMYCMALLALDCRVVTSNRLASGDAAYRQAVDLLEQRNNHDALPLLNIAAALMPDVPSVRWDRARANMAMGNYKAALTDCDAALKLDPKSKIALMVRGAVYHALSEDDRAVEDLTKVLKIDSRNPMAFNNLAWSLTALGKYPEAINDATKAIELKRTAFMFYDTRGVALLMNGQPKEALADFQRSITLRRNDGASAYHIACAYRLLGQEQLAQVNLQRSQQMHYSPELWELKFDNLKPLKS